MSEAPVTLGRFVEFLKFGTLAEDDPRRTDLQLVLNAAVALVARRCGPLAVGAATLRVRASGRNLVVPATGLASVTQVRDPHGNVVVHDARRSNLAAGIVAVPARAGDGFWEVDAQVGTAQVPDEVVLAILIIGSHLWETQRGRSSRPQSYDGAVPADVVPRGFAIPSRAAELLADYELPGFA